jgi:hypothetical protein
MLHEYVGNLHCHTVYSDGWGRHNDLARAAINAGLDFLVVTDHNVWVQGLDGYRLHQDQRLLLLTGQEIHDPTRQPQKNHLLTYETGQELAAKASDPQRLIDAVQQADGLSFLAHPFDPPAPLFDEDNLSWESWDVDGYTGLEIWNFMTEYKGLLTSWRRAIYYAYRPDLIASGPFPETVARWDQLLAAGRKVVGIGGSDAHALPVRKGPLKRVIFPYEFLFRAVNTHVLTETPLTGEVDIDRKRLFLSLRRGRCFIGYDLPASTRGFRFNAASDEGEAEMGDTLHPRFGVTLQIHAPRRCRLQLLCDGEPVQGWSDRSQAVLTVHRPGAYRVEAYLPYRGRERTWILSNAIYIRSAR